MKDWNTCFAYLNMELPDDIRRLKEAGYYNAAIARIDACLAEDCTVPQSGNSRQGLPPSMRCAGVQFPGRYKWAGR